MGKKRTMRRRNKREKEDSTLVAESNVNSSFLVHKQNTNPYFERSIKSHAETPRMLHPCTGNTRACKCIYVYLLRQDWVYALDSVTQLLLLTFAAQPHSVSGDGCSYSDEWIQRTYRPDVPI